MKLREIVKKYREDNGLSQRQFAANCDLSNGYISILEDGKMPSTGAKLIPTLTTLKKIATGMHISLDSLLSMADDMPVSLSGHENSIFGLKGIEPLPKMRRVPLLGTIACGEPILAEQNYDGYTTMPDTVDADFSLRCKGDSMKDAGIHDGDIVYIKKQEDVDNGQIAAVLIGEEATLKRVYKENNKLVLQPENRTYPPLVYVGEELSTVRIIGLAVACLTAVR